MTIKDFVSPEEAIGIKELVESHAILRCLPLFSYGWRSAASRFEQAAYSLLAKHPNWDDETGVLLDNYDNPSNGFRVAKVPYREVTRAQHLIASLIKYVDASNLDEPTLETVQNFEHVVGCVGALMQIHPDYDYEQRRILNPGEERSEEI